jgi:hypothetical protein
MSETISMELSPDEAEVINNIRAKRAEDELRRRMCIKYLETARKYSEWLNDNGMGDTYSTLCNDFGYEADKGERRRSTYDSIGIIIEKAKSCADSDCDFISSDEIPF